MTLETPHSAGANPSRARSQSSDSAPQPAQSSRAFLLSRRRSVQSALAFTLFPITTIAETHMNTSTATVAPDATVARGIAASVRSIPFLCAHGPFPLSIVTVAAYNCAGRPVSPASGTAGRRTWRAAVGLSATSDTGTVGDLTTGSSRVTLVGQSDPGEMAGGTYAIVGGFWAVDAAAGLPCPADITGDDQVGPADLGNLLAAWGTNPGGPPDFSGNGNVGPEDLGTLLAGWGQCP